ncbi:prolipoprotein diacylglyceryl transferase [Liquorilactobacillus satsumensis]|uniref:prolipoprotein diacylglyceryl transferase n=1 Tax=Liquorilactobacillus satsumensis TaxID=259059 RepID=UPI0021C34B2B|nr:prolipoprotein diacylglyceryl transferase [Liquorilactobacillus satsumensis]MCP9356446.1 prolipoprotein diacylglyceryl transferase [Liquorilactobacillus satsumensis]MCP9370415.1 prolipoprotein diacylglyceryl transferase [Liquorilactobacillus satsumensis]
MNYLFGALNPMAFSVGPLEVHWYGIIIASAVVLAVILAVREGKRRGISEDTVYDLLLWAMPFSIISARIYYVIFQWSYYSQHLNEVYRIWDGGIAIYGALIGAIIVIIFFCRQRQIPVWLLLDVIAPTVIMAQGIGRWGNFMNQEAHGVKTTLSFLQELHLPEFIIRQMNIKGTYYQPTFLYESAWDLAGFVVLLGLRHRKGLFKRGEVFFGYVIWYSFGRFFVEGMRTDSLMLGSLRVSQWLSVILFGGAIVWLLLRRYWRPLDPWYLDGTKDVFEK